jgi:hypothetical protein
MSSVLPPNKLDQIQFCEDHTSVWSAAPTTIGLTAAMCTSLTSLTGDARKAYDNAQAARQASKAATTEYNAAVTAMRSKAAEMIGQIKAFAALQASPAAVYATAQIPQPAAPSPVPAPGVPTNIVVTLEPSGAVTLSWEAANSAASGGAFFNIFRKLPGQTAFTSIGGAPGSTSESRRPSFTDQNVPTSAAGNGVQYIIQGFRGTSMGPASPSVTVQFGNGGDGANVSFSSSAGVKLAA